VSLINFSHSFQTKHNSNAEKVVLVIERQALIEILLQVIVNKFHKDDKAEMKTVCSN